MSFADSSLLPTPSPIVPVFISGLLERLDMMPKERILVTEVHFLMGKNKHLHKKRFVPAIKQEM